MRQAVVVIHGIGEQRPMETLRSFVDTIIDGEHKAGRPNYFSKPNWMPNSYELRILSTLKSKKREWPRTDFYEFYWAHHMRDSKYSHVLSWLCRVLLRLPSSVPKELRFVYWQLWVGLILTGCVIYWNKTYAGSASIAGWGISYQFIVAALFNIGQLVLSWLMLGYVADAARYLTPSPGNIDQRNKIRSEAIELIRNLHRSGKYSRIVVVGHSLGSVIGYDVIRFLWDEMRWPTVNALEKSPELSTYQEDLTNILNKSTTQNGKDELFQQKQRRLWRELRGPTFKIPWLISDFVTLGSPLAHAGILLANNSNELQQKIQECEYPTCPPTLPKGEDIFYKVNSEIDIGGITKPFTKKVVHHGAPFSCTRWTNLYVPYRLGIFGDVIGGPLSRVFGAGIKDIPVRITDREDKSGVLSSVFNRLIGAHTCYWKYSSYSRLSKWIDRLVYKNVTRDSIKALRRELKLDALRSKNPWPEP